MLMLTGLVEEAEKGGLGFLYSYKKNNLVRGGEKRDIISMHME